ncbi:porin family protein [Tenacibaculum sp. MEBiC06402]|uniref:porin family protein n=1 Tax=unclassified Tenacibaculum TaxID=2635139 RepID=UPI003B996124
MRLRFFIVLSIMFCSYSVAQRDSLRLGQKYWEDQLYMAISYNVMRNQPESAETTGFSYSLSFGYIKDVPFTKKGNFSAGLGVGYSYSSFNHDLQVVDDNTLQIADGIVANKLKTHNLEFPIQFRWRTSDAVTYSFWRVYAGLNLSYNLNNSFSYELNTQAVEFSNIPIYNKFQSGLELSAGYGAFNFYFYYGLSPVYQNVEINGDEVTSKITKFGLIFYLL